MKRLADNQLNRDNYDDEIEDVQVVDRPRMADASVLKDRVLVKAKRRLATDTNNQSSTNIFSGFKGLFREKKSSDCLLIGNIHCRLCNSGQ